MIDVYLNRKKIKVAQNFFELSHDQLKQLQKSPTPHGAIKALLGVEASKIYPPMLDGVLELVSFVFEPPEYFLAEPVDVGELELGKELQARDLLNGKPYPWFFCFEICEIYQVEKNHSKGLALISSVFDLYQTFSELHLVEKIDEDLEAAGAERLVAFDKLMLIDELAGGDVLKWKEVEKLPARIAYSKLLMEKVKNDVQRNYEKIKKA